MASEKVVTRANNLTETDIMQFEGQFTTAIYAKIGELVGKFAV